MATYKIPVTNKSSNYRQAVELNNEIYNLAFHYNDRAQAWFVSIYKEDFTPILLGQKVVSDWVLGRYTSTADLPIGEIQIIDTTNSGIEADETNFGETVIILYQEA